MAASETAIGNLALSHLGSSARISSLTEASTEARHISLHYATCRDSLLEELDWTFATKSAALALLAEEPNDLWGFAYAKPADCLKALRIVPSMASQTPYPFRLMQYGAQAAIYTDVEDAYLEYVERVTDVTRFSNHFTETLALKIAVAVALSINPNAVGTRDRVFQEYRMALAKAKSLDMNTGVSQPDDSLPENLSVRLWD